MRQGARRGRCRRFGCQAGRLRADHRFRLPGDDQGLKLWQETPAYAFKKFRGAFVANEARPRILGVGYIIGFRTASIMVGGGLLASFVLTPIFAMFTGDVTQELDLAQTQAWVKSAVNMFSTSEPAQWQPAASSA